ncbi:MAG: hypothetical protein CVU39_19680 [Chloroflexi bacterium HGW-Chloroflexi-10]|nr:MAG: hypothetical protein CVU39_19680 [Chloroflexi bacterium HGW-Chloroflexi-10]
MCERHWDRWRWERVHIRFFRLSLKIFQSERMYFREMTGMGGDTSVEMADMVVFCGYSFWNEWGNECGTNREEQ